MTVDPASAREAWRLAEPLHSMIFFVPEAQERYDALGVPATAGYFASRGGVFGAVGAGPVIATFYNFNPRIVARALPAVWEHVTPAAVLAARIDAADAALTRGLGETIKSPELAEAAVLARRAAESATAYAAGRPLFAATAALALARRAAPGALARAGRAAGIPRGRARGGAAGRGRERAAGDHPARRLGPDRRHVPAGQPGLEPRRVGRGDGGAALSGLVEGEQPTLPRRGGRCGPGSRPTPTGWPSRRTRSWATTALRGSPSWPGR